MIFQPFGQVKFRGIGPCLSQNVLCPLSCRIILPQLSFLPLLGSLPDPTFRTGMTVAEATFGASLLVPAPSLGMVSNNKSPLIFLISHSSCFLLPLSRSLCVSRCIPTRLPASLVYRGSSVIHCTQRTINALCMPSATPWTEQVCINKALVI